MITPQQANCVREQVQELCAQDRLTCWAHAYPHVERVEQASIDMANLLNHTQEDCAVTACCHDLGRIIESKLLTKLIKK